MTELLGKASYTHTHILSLIYNPKGSDFSIEKFYFNILAHVRILHFTYIFSKKVLKKVHTTYYLKMKSAKSLNNRLFKSLSECLSAPPNRFFFFKGKC